MKKFFLIVSIALMCVGFIVYRTKTDRATLSPVAAVASFPLAPAPSATPPPLNPPQSASSEPPAAPPKMPPEHPKQPKVKQTPPVHQDHGKYKDGNYTGSLADAFYGNVQIKVAIQHGKITSVAVLDFPQDRATSLNISRQSIPALISEAIKIQTARVDIVTGATQTSEAFQQSLNAALAQAS